MVEPRESGAFQAAAEDFRAKLANPAYNGAVFFAVTRQAPRRAVMNFLHVDVDAEQCYERSRNKIRHYTFNGCVCILK